MKTEQLCWAWWRWNVSFMYAHNMSTLHIHTHLKDCKAMWQNLQTLNIPPLLEIEKTWKFYIYFVQNSSIGQLSQHSQHHTPSMELHYSNSCQQFSFTFIQHMRLLVADFWYTHWVCYPVYQRPTLETNTRHHATHPPSRMWNQTWYHLHLRATSFHILP